MQTKNIAVFYHLFIPDVSTTWTWWVDEQMSLLKSTGLADVSTVNMCITLPLGICDEKKDVRYDGLVINYITENYPFVNILNVRGTHEENLFEGQTVSQLYQYCLKNDGYVFYFHNKGMSSYATHIPYCLKDWRHYMQYFNIERWQDCVAKLEEGYDCAGVSWIKREDLAGDIPTEGKRYIGNHFSGNYWWARNDYIRRLPDPLKVEDYVHVPSMMDHFKTYRYAFELWIGDENTKYYSFHQSKTHHYFEQFPREKYVLSDRSIKIPEISVSTLMQEVGSKNFFNWREHIKFAQWIVKRKNPDIIVDLGVDYGYSTFSFGLPKIGKIYGIDSFEGDKHAGERDTYNYVIETQKKLELDHITFIKGYFDEVAKIWDKPIDILHIDGLHTYEAIKNDFDTWSKFLKNGGIILMHDTCVQHADFGVYKFFDEIKLPKLNFKVSHGLGVVTIDTKLLEEIRTEFKETLDERY